MNNTNVNGLSLLGRTIEKFDDGHFINKYEASNGLVWYFAFRWKGSTLLSLGRYSHLVQARTKCDKGTRSVQVAKDGLPRFIFNPK